MIKVLLMIDDASVGGGQQHVLWLAENLDRSKFEVAVACEGRGYLVEQLEKRGIPVYPLSISNRLNLRSFLQCNAVIKDFAPDILHTHGGTAGFYGRVMARFARVPFAIHTYHGLHYLHAESKANKLIHTWIDHILLRWTDRIICVSLADFNLGAKTGIVNPATAIVIRNGIEIQKYSRLGHAGNSARKPKPQMDQKVVGAIGRLHPQKGHIYLLEAARLVLKGHPSTIFQIVGTGELERHLKEKAIEFGIADHVQFLGARTDIPELLAAMDLFVLPSLWEGQPIVLMEAMAARTPIIATAIDGVTEMIESSCDGLLVPARNVSELAGAIALLLGDASLAERLSQRAFDKVMREFDIKDTVLLMDQLYTSLVTSDQHS